MPELYELLHLEEDVKIQVSVDPLPSKDEVEKVLDGDIDRFEEFFVGLVFDGGLQAPLTRPERAILKTYLTWKLLRDQG